MGGFLKYLDKMENDFSTGSVKKKEKYVEKIVEQEDMYVDEVEEDISESESYDISIYKKRMVNELFNLGLSKPKINAVIQNVFSEDYEDDGIMVEYDEPQVMRQPQRKMSFKERMHKMKQQQQQGYYSQQQGIPQNSKFLKKTADVAADILAGVPSSDDPYYAPSEMGVGGGMQQPMMNQPQQYYGQQPPIPNYNRPIGNQFPGRPPMPQQMAPQGPPPPPMPMATINDANVGSVAVAPQQSMLKMPEGFENFKPEGEKLGESKNIPIQSQVQVAMGILDEPRGTSVCEKPAKIGEVKQGEVHNVEFGQPQQPPAQAQVDNNTNAILEAPSGPPPVALQAMGGTADHASQLL